MVTPLYRRSGAVAVGRGQGWGLGSGPTLKTQTWPGKGVAARRLKMKGGGPESHRPSGVASNAASRRNRTPERAIGKPKIVKQPALPPKADIRRRIEHVCFVPEADIERTV